jgi:hypothetical protein
MNLFNLPGVSGILKSIAGTLEENLRQQGQGFLNHFEADHTARAISKAVETHLTQTKGQDAAVYIPGVKARATDYAAALDALGWAQADLEKKRGTTDEGPARVTREAAETIANAAFGVLIAYAEQG